MQSLVTVPVYTNIAMRVKIIAIWQHLKSYILTSDLIELTLEYRVISRARSLAIVKEKM